MPTAKGDKVWWRVPKDWTRLKVAIYVKAIVHQDSIAETVVILYREPREGSTTVKRYQRVRVSELSARLDGEPLTTGTKDED